VLKIEVFVERGGAVLVLTNVGPGAILIEKERSLIDSLMRARVDGKNIESLSVLCRNRFHMYLVDAVRRSSWRAQLALEFERRGARTVLAARRHDGPLVVQKPLYPEGDDVCHAIIVHPPGGIAGGDEIELQVCAGAQVHVLLTTPGAGKWYRSAGSQAHQRLTFDIQPGAILEWLPQGNIIFDGALADLSLEVRLSGNAGFIGWEIVCLGRTGCGESFTHGVYRARSLIQRNGKPLWFELANLHGGGAELRSSAIMAGAPVAGTLIATGPGIDNSVLGLCREAKPGSGEAAATLLPGLLAGRYLGSSSESARNYFIQLWRILRPALAARTAVEPRIWQT
jgi:urease accessory protein